MGLHKQRLLWLVLLVGIFVFLFIQSNWLGKWMYPIAYQAEIIKHSTVHNVDPLLVAAIIRVETNFRTGHESSKGAIGIMQIMPETALWILKKLKLHHRWTVGELKNNPELNILIGTWYLQFLYKQFNHNWIAAIAAYNAGPHKVSKWISSKRWDATYYTVKKHIPYKETKLYVQRVIHYYNKYKVIYT